MPSCRPGLRTPAGSAPDWAAEVDPLLAGEHARCSPSSTAEDRTIYRIAAGCSTCSGSKASTEGTSAKAARSSKVAERAANVMRDLVMVLILLACDGGRDQPHRPERPARLPKTLRVASRFSQPFL